jgi:hypothetical protein
MQDVAAAMLQSMPLRFAMTQSTQELQQELRNATERALYKLR